jgi:hypothetical protein
MDDGYAGLYSSIITPGCLGEVGHHLTGHLLPNASRDPIGHHEVHQQDQEGFSLVRKGNDYWGEM